MARQVAGFLCSQNARPIPTSPPSYVLPERVLCGYYDPVGATIRNRTSSTRVSLDACSPANKPQR